MESKLAQASQVSVPKSLTFSVIHHKVWICDHAVKVSSFFLLATFKTNDLKMQTCTMCLHFLVLPCSKEKQSGGEKNLFKKKKKSGGHETHCLPVYAFDCLYGHMPPARPPCAVSRADLKLGRIALSSRRGDLQDRLCSHRQRSWVS